MINAGGTSREAMAAAATLGDHQAFDSMQVLLGKEPGSTEASGLAPKTQVVPVKDAVGVKWDEKRDEEITSIWVKHAAVEIWDDVAA